MEVKLKLPTTDNDIIRKASKRYPEAREALKELFPEAFEELEYCCKPFERLHLSGVLTYHPKHRRSQFTTARTWPDFCPFCTTPVHPLNLK